MVTPSSSSLYQISIKLWVSIQILFFFFFVTSSLSLSHIHSSKISFTEYFNSIVPKFSVDYSSISNSNFPQLRTAYFNGGDPILAQNPNFLNNKLRFLRFHSEGVYNTYVDGVLKVELSLSFRVAGMNPIPSNFTNKQSKPGRFRTQTDRFPVRRNSLSFMLAGFWSESSGKLCMVGSGQGYSKEGKLLDLSAVFKLSYPQNSSIFTSFVTGTLESVDSSESENYFNPISVLAFSQRNYMYTLIPESSGNNFSEGGDFPNDSALDLEQGNICPSLLRNNLYEIKHDSDCFSTKNCNPVGGGNGFLPQWMIFKDLRCSENQGLVRLLISFSDANFPVYNQPSVMDRLLVGEGMWHKDDKLLRLVACRVLNYTDSLVNASIGDCSVRLSIWFPAVVSIKSKRRVAGLLWSTRSVNESGYFQKIAFQQNGISVVPGLKYEYTKIEEAIKSCPTKPARKKGNRYPSEYSSDMRFKVRLTNNEGESAMGYFTPLSVGDQFYKDPWEIMEIARTHETSILMKENSSHLINVSYNIHIIPDHRRGTLVPSSDESFDLNKRIEISAEGIYNFDTGNVCMVGCRDHSPDCEILIDVQFSPLDSNSSVYVMGTIQNRKDTLHFSNMQLSAVVDQQIWFLPSVH